jgi:hypothetical protein
MLAAYQKIYSIYQTNAAARSQTVSAYQLSNDLICWKKTSGTSAVLILVNVRNSNINVNLPPILAGNFVNLMTNQNETVGTSLSLTPYAYKIYSMN